MTTTTPNRLSLRLLGEKLMDAVSKKVSVRTICFILVILILQNIWHSSRLHTDLIVDLHHHAAGPFHSGVVASDDESSSSLTIVPGELPGYTGWARPKRTLAGYFQLYQISTPEMMANHDWFFTVSCDLDLCNNGGAHFYVRAYGPSVMTGQVRDIHDGSYDIRILPLDPGHYTLEVVLVSSYAPEFGSFPMKNEPAYEGYMLPDFPMQLTVAPDDTLPEEASSKTQNQPPPPPPRLCSVKQLLDKKVDDAYGKARWVVADKNVLPFHRKKQVSTAANREGYDSLGIKMDFELKTCALLPQESLGTSDFGMLTNLCLKRNKDPTKPIHIIFVGDSVALLQQMSMKKTLASIGQDRIRITHISTTSSGFRLTLDHVMRQLEQIKSENPKERRFVFFNTALHDMAKICSEHYRTERIKETQRKDADYSCAQEYEDYLAKFIGYMETYPAEMRVFQSTSAGWLRYGNYGVGWSRLEKEYISMSPNFVAYLNEIAYKILADAKGIKIVDSYWMSLSRPDNRQAGPSNETIGNELIHPGPEVVNAMERMWWIMIFRTLCGDGLDEIVNVVHGNDGSTQHSTD